MALTEHDKKTLSKADQNKIVAATNKWNAANAKGDTAGMAAAAKEAQTVRNNAGYKTDDSGNYTGSYTKPATTYSSGSGGSSNKNSQYTAKGTYNDAGLPAYALQQINAIKEQYNNETDPNKRNELHDAAEAIRKAYGYSGGEDGSEYLTLDDWLENWNNQNPQPEYQDTYDPQIDEMINRILNREDFSYNALDDPLYQQYVNMYQREGDRAMKETMAEAAAGAGGMNSYAITAAQQANNYYSSQLNDKIPELYQLAYEMYLADKESQIQDLGILQNASATQYNRYRDTMDDWKSDRNFAYDMYQTDIANGQWQQQFNNNNYWINKEFENDNYWANKEFDYNAGRNEISDSRYDKETAYNEVWNLINNMVDASLISDELIAKAGMTREQVEAAIAIIKGENTPTGRSYSGGGSGGSGGNGYIGSNPIEETTGEYAWQKGLTDLGLGLVYDPSVLTNLESVGAIYEKNGKLYWADGWNAQNFKSKLAASTKYTIGNPLL